MLKKYFHSVDVGDETFPQGAWFVLSFDEDVNGGSLAVNGAEYGGWIEYQFTCTFLAVLDAELQGAAVDTTLHDADNLAVMDSL